MTRTTARHRHLGTCLAGALALAGNLAAASGPDSGYGSDEAPPPDANSQPQGEEAAAGAPRWYSFSWRLGPSDEHAPRGGTTQGPEVTPAEEPAGEWLALQAEGITRHERDRRAIRALAGGYRTTFDFVETATFVPGKGRARPYQSWATELIFVLADEPDLISLQHLLVMSFRDEDGELRGPFVQKHWRQDWRHESRASLAYRGEGRWAVERRPAEAVAGTWTQTVYQVDDSPRYAATGTWTHHGQWSSWQSRREWRPLPRREHTVRDDYDVTAGEHRITITPGGWTHAQDNLKAVLAAPGRLHPETPYVASEVGLSRYTRIRDYDFSAGREYWEETQGFWRIVREAWAERLAPGVRFRIRGEVDGEPMFVPLFEYAQTLTEDEPFDPEEARRRVHEILARYVTESD